MLALEVNILFSNIPNSKCFFFSGITMNFQMHRWWFFFFNLQMNKKKCHLTTEPHDKHHFGCDFVISEKVQQERKRKDIHSSTKKNQDLKRDKKKKKPFKLDEHGSKHKHWEFQLTVIYRENNSTYDAPDDERYFKFVRKTKDRETEEGKHTGLWWERVNIKSKESYNKKANNQKCAHHTWRLRSLVFAAWGSGWQGRGCDGCSGTWRSPQTGWTLFLQRDTMDVEFSWNQATFTG